jgi:hypothetical protein
VHPDVHWAVGAPVRQLVNVVRCRGGEQTGAGRRWGLSLEERVLLIALYYRTTLTVLQVAMPFGVSKSAAGRVVEHLASYPALTPSGRRAGPSEVSIVDGTLMRTRDRAVAASSKSYRYSTNLQVLIDVNTRLTVVVGRPLPGGRNDCRAHAESGIDRQAGRARVIADGGYHVGPAAHVVIILFRRARDGTELPSWQEDLYAVHRRVRARVEHAFARYKTWKILRDCRRKGHGVYHATHRGRPPPQHRPHRLTSRPFNTAGQPVSRNDRRSLCDNL